MSGEQTDLLGALAESMQRARQRTKDNDPCATCGGDRLGTDFTGSGRCHAPRAAGVTEQGGKTRE